MPSPGGRGDAGRWGEGVPSPRSRCPGPLRVNAALPQANAASHPFPAQSVLLTCPQLRFPAPLGRADALLRSRSCITALGIRKGLRGALAAGSALSGGSERLPAPVCRGGEGAVPASAAGGSPAPVPSSRASGGEGAACQVSAVLVREETCVPGL